MSIRSFGIVITDLGANPSSIDKAGIQGEHEATKLVFTLPSAYVNSGYKYFIECIDAYGVGGRSEYITPVTANNSTTISFDIPSSITLTGRTEIILNVELSNSLIRSVPIELSFIRAGAVTQALSDLWTQLLGDAVDKAQNYIVVSESEPENSNVKIWVNPNGQTVTIAGESVLIPSISIRKTDGEFSIIPAIKGEPGLTEEEVSEIQQTVNSAVSAAETATTNANAKAGLANTAASNAQTAADTINALLPDVNTAISNAQDATQNALAAVSGVQSDIFDTLGIEIPYQSVTLTNLVTNGDFSSGVTGWSAAAGSGASISAANGILTMTGGTTAYPQFKRSIGTGNILANDKVYYRIRFRSNTSLATSCSLYLIRNVNTFVVLQNSPVNGTWYEKSGVMTINASTTSGDCTCQFASNYGSAADANGATIDVDYIMLMNLTTLYGAGNEPTAAATDALLLEHDSNIYFEGTHTIMFDSYSLGKLWTKKNGAMQLISPDDLVIADTDNLYTTDTVGGALKEAKQGINTLSTQLTTTNTAINTSVSALAAAYSASSTYAIGDYCTYGGELYICKATIATPRAWSINYWDKTSLGAKLIDIKAGAKNKAFNAFTNPRVSIYVEETRVTNGDTYIYAIGPGTLYPFQNFTWSQVCSAIPDYVATSPVGVANCIKIPSNKALVWQSGGFAVVAYGGIDLTNCVLFAWCVHGSLMSGAFMDSMQSQVFENIEFNKSLSDGNSECMAIAARIMENQKANSFTFGLISDSHVDYVTELRGLDNSIYSYNMALSMGNFCRVNLTFMGGDILKTGDENDKTKLKKIINRYISNIVGKATMPIAYTIGNHDTWTYTATSGVYNTLKSRCITPEELYLLIGVHNEKSLVTNPDNVEGGYGYFDDNKSKIRAFCLNTYDVPMVDAPGDSTRWKYNGDTWAGMRNAQLVWFGKSLESLPEGWAIIIFSHIPMETSAANGVRFGFNGASKNATPFFGILNAFRDGTSYAGSYSLGDYPYDISVDFTSRGAGEVICLVCGHVPCDNSSNMVGGVGAPEYGYRYLSIDGGIRFAMFDVDRSTKTIRVYKHGGKNLYNPNMTNPPIIGLTDSDVNEFGDWVTTYN